jgi:hypothetical protein
MPAILMELYNSLSVLNFNLANSAESSPNENIWSLIKRMSKQNKLRGP